MPLSKNNSERTGLGGIQLLSRLVQQLHASTGPLYSQQDAIGAPVESSDTG